MSSPSAPPPSSRQPGGFAVGQTNSPLALGQEPELAGQWPDWLANLILDLGAAGMGVLSGASR